MGHRPPRDLTQAEKRAPSEELAFFRAQAHHPRRFVFSQRENASGAGSLVPESFKRGGERIGQQILCTEMYKALADQPPILLFWRPVRIFRYRFDPLPVADHDVPSAGFDELLAGKAIRPVASEFLRLPVRRH
jgi:hypothetical protein